MRLDEITKQRRSKTELKAFQCLEVREIRRNKLKISEGIAIEIGRNQWCGTLEHHRMYLKEGMINDVKCC